MTEEDAMHSNENMYASGAQLVERVKQRNERNLISEYLHCHVYWIMLMKFDANV